MKPIDLSLGQFDEPLPAAAALAMGARPAGAGVAR